MREITLFITAGYDFCCISAFSAPFLTLISVKPLRVAFMAVKMVLITRLNIVHQQLINSYLPDDIPPPLCVKLTHVARGSWVLLRVWSVMKGVKMSCAWRIQN